MWGPRMSRRDGRTGAGTPPLTPPAAVTLGITAAASFGLGLLVRFTRYGAEPLVTEHLVSYQSHGFVRRGLVGTLVHPLVSTRTDVIVAMLAVSTLGSVALCWLLLRFSRSLSDPGQAWFVLASSATVYAQLGWDYGRVDVLVLAVLVALWITLGSGPNSVLPTALVVIGGLVHEMTLLWAAALLGGAGLARAATWRELRRPAAAIGVTGAGLLLGGGFEGTDDAFIAAMPVELAGAGTAVLGRAAPWTGDIGTGVASVARLVDLVEPLDWVVLPLVAAVCAVVVGRRLGPAAVAITLLPAVALASVGIDHVRWAFLLAFLTVLQLAQVGALPRWEPARATLMAALFTVAGAWGLMTVLPYWRFP